MKRLLLLATLASSTQAQQKETWTVQQLSDVWVMGNGTSTVPVPGRMFTLQDGTIVPDGSLYVALAGNPITGEWYSLTENGWTAMTPNKAIWPPTAVAYRQSRNDQNGEPILVKKGLSTLTPALPLQVQLYLAVFAVSDMSRAKPGQVGIFTAPSWKLQPGGTLLDIDAPDVYALMGSVDGGSLRLANPTVVTPMSKEPSLSVVFNATTTGDISGIRTFAVQSSNLNAFSGYELQYSFNLEKWFSSRGYTGFNSSMSWSLTGNAKSMFFRLAK